LITWEVVDLPSWSLETASRPPWCASASWRPGLDGILGGDVFLGAAEARAAATIFSELRRLWRDVDARP
jgi:hypothetical protein